MMNLEGMQKLMDEYRSVSNLVEVLSENKHDLAICVSGVKSEYIGGGLASREVHYWDDVAPVDSELLTQLLNFYRAKQLELKSDLLVQGVSV